MFGELGLWVGWLLGWSGLLAGGRVVGICLRFSEWKELGFWGSGGIGWVGVFKGERLRIRTFLNSVWLYLYFFLFGSVYFVIWLFFG